jgi:hypothetical protein
MPSHRHVLVALLASVAACDGDPEPRVRLPAIVFDSASVAEREAIAEAVVLAPHFARAAVANAELDHAATPACPARRVSGRKVIYEASGCEGGATGIHHAGRIEVENPPLGQPGDPAFDAKEATVVRFAGSEAVLAADTVKLEGIFAYTSIGIELLDLTVDRGLPVYISSYSACIYDACVAQGGDAFGELVGVGSFAIESSLHLDVSETGHAKLVGYADLLGEERFEIKADQELDGGCYAYVVDGQESLNLFCLPDPQLFAAR